MRNDPLTRSERDRLQEIADRRYDASPDVRLTAWACRVRRANQHLDALLAGEVVLDKFAGQAPLFALPQRIGAARRGRRPAA